jgi:hypothetical protein
MFQKGILMNFLSNYTNNFGGINNKGLLDKKQRSTLADANLILSTANNSIHLIGNVTALLTAATVRSKVHRIEKSIKKS